MNIFSEYGLWFPNRARNAFIPGRTSIVGKMLFLRNRTVSSFRYPKLRFLTRKENFKEIKSSKPEAVVSTSTGPQTRLACEGL